MKKITRWKPDTCDCLLEYEWDINEDESTRVHTPTTVVHACEDHQADNTGSDSHTKVFNKVHGENTGKNKALKVLLDQLPKDKKKDLYDSTGLVIGQDFVTPPTWKFTADRKLEIVHESLSDSTLKNKIKVAIDIEVPHSVILK